jgi:cell division protein ZipA
MDIGLREWLIIGGLLVIGLIIFDGWRRMKGQRNTLKIDIDSNFVDSEDNDHNSELPNGGARMLRDIKTGLFYADPVAEPSRSHERIDPGFDHLSEYVEPEHAQTKQVDPAPVKSAHAEPARKQGKQEARIVKSNKELDPLFDDIPETLSSARKVSTDVFEDDMTQEDSIEFNRAESNDADLKRALTVESLTPIEESSTQVKESSASIERSSESIFAAQEKAPAAQQTKSQPEFLDLEQPITVLMRQASEKTGVREEPQPEEFTEEMTEQFAPASADTYSRNTNFSATDDPVFIDDASIKEESIAERGQDSVFEDKKLENARSDRKAREQAPEPEEVLVITVVGKDAPLEGQTLLQVVLACGMRFGDMNLFHRFEEGIDKGAVQFSMANAVNPGTFDLEHMSDMTTPGVSFFMSMSEPADAKNAFECMLATAETVSKHVGGDLLDENRSVMRPQTKAHYRERIREFEMHNRHRRS